MLMFYQSVNKDYELISILNAGNNYCDTSSVSATLVFSVCSCMNGAMPRKGNFCVLLTSDGVLQPIHSTRPAQPESVQMINGTSFMFNLMFHSCLLSCLTIMWHYCVTVVLVCRVSSVGMSVNIYIYIYI